MDIPALTLLEFNRRVARLMQHESVQRCWIVAETSDVRVSGGHCYLELVQKDPDRGTTVASGPTATPISATRLRARRGRPSAAA